MEGCEDNIPTTESVRLAFGARLPFGDAPKSPAQSAWYFLTLHSVPFCSCVATYDRWSDDQKEAFQRRVSEHARVARAKDWVSWTDARKAGFWPSFDKSEEGVRVLASWYAGRHL